MEFADFLAPFDTRRFRSEYFGQRPLHIQKSAGSRPKLLGWARFNEVLAIAPYWNEDTLKVYFKSRAALRENYCDTAELRPGASAPVNPAKVRALLGLGASLIANHVHTICPEVGAVAAMLEREFAARAFANVYCSFKGVQAFQTHFDLHDVFAVQAEGEKTWRIYESRADTPVLPLPPGDEIEKWLTESRGALLFEAHMKPGDVLYLPRGQYHDALTGAQASLHVTFGVAPATGLALFKLLESALLRESEFRAYLPDARSESELRERLAQLAERVKAVLTSPAFAIDVLNHQRSLARAPAGYDLPVQQPPAWYSVARRAQVIRRDQGFAVVCDGGEIPLGATSPTVEWILKQRMFSMDDALARQPGIDRALLQGDLERLVRAGIIVETAMR
ncbi:MAG TPA: cupin domain-containing protein [Steroidobacteraceae bacterium]|nr:cupin domain-containing protein [Steroidobacteraceae bacterium]